MDLTDKIRRIETIERYYNLELSIEEMNEFEEILQNDSRLREEVNDYRELFYTFQTILLKKQALAMMQQVEHENKISGSKENTTEESNFLDPKLILVMKKNLVRIVIGSAAACLAFILYVSTAVIQLPGSENDLSIVRDIDPNVLSPIQRNAYDYFYAGQLHIVEGQFMQATFDFQEVLKNKNLRPYFQEATQWHLLVAYLKCGQVAQADALFGEISRNPTPIYEVDFLNRAKVWWQLFWAKI